MAPPESLGPLAIEVELSRERASALKRTGGNLEQALHRMEAIRQEVASASAVRGAELSPEYARLRAEAERQRWFLVVQREAMGLHHHGVLDELYVIPPPLDR